MMISDRVYSDPSMNMENEAYWAAAKEGRLVLKRCRECKKIHFFPRAICPHCQSSDTEWVPAKGRGRIYSYSVMRRAKTPYVIAYVTLEEGVSMLTNIVDCDADRLSVNQTVEVTFHSTESGHALPVFRPT
ncbi:Zn-ribbon domain-containing OB-fold protein [Sneathiella aquimaris]|uniref:Zn-ribbon domain-containing OB-fold protein n=1 Tax=Sneathiella aquimaris TaxID=2599305 RepID=UPI001C671920|nr:Zn-ribbon domain-containing OB-fold protein [Sneathiella aquimaris]